MHFSANKDRSHVRIALWQSQSTVKSRKHESDQNKSLMCMLLYMYYHIFNLIEKYPMSIG